MSQAYFALVDDCQAYPDTVGTAESDVVKALENAVLDMCNECTSSYAEMEQVLVKINDKGCYPHASSFKCTSECQNLVASYVDFWTRLLENGVCRQSMPGGCGNGGGMSEGAVYDQLVEMTAQINSFKTLPVVCEPSCLEAYGGWYNNWKRSIADGCMQVDGVEIDFANNKGGSALSTIVDIAPTCTEEVRHFF